MSKLNFKTVKNLADRTNVHIELSNDVAQPILDGLKDGIFAEEMAEAGVHQNKYFTDIEFTTTHEKADFLMKTIVQVSFAVLNGQPEN